MNSRFSSEKLKPRVLPSVPYPSSPLSPSLPSFLCFCHAFVYVYITVHVWRSENNFWELVLLLAPYGDRSLLFLLLHCIPTKIT